ncbi:MAG: hypothetical protein ACT4OW_04835 [Nitrososphaerota archaeon]
MNYAPRSARNWYTAMGILFIIMALIVLTRNLIIWGPGFVLDFLLSSEITNEKVSLGMIVFGSFLIIVGFKKRTLENR